MYIMMLFSGDGSVGVMALGWRLPGICGLLVMPHDGMACAMVCENVSKYVCEKDPS